MDKPMTKPQCEILALFLEDEFAEIDQIHFLSGGNISQNSLTVVTYLGGARITQTFDADGNCESTHYANVVR